MKFQKTLASLVIALAVVVGLAGSASALTAADIDLLVALGIVPADKAAAAKAALGGSSSTMFNVNLSVGMTSPDVIKLQQYLNAQGFTVAAIGAGSPGKETSYFGNLTANALRVYQAAKGLAQTGALDAATRAKINGSSSTPNPSTPNNPTASGEEGELNSFDTLGDVESDIDEGDEEQMVLGVEFDAEDSEMNIERVDVDFTKDGGNGSDNLDDYIESVSIWLDGDMLAEADVDEADEDDDVYSFRFTGLDGMVDEGETGELYVAVNVVRNLDSTDDADTWTVEIPANGIRAVDGAGISDTYVSSGDDLEETFSVSTAEVGSLQISEASESPEEGIIVVDDQNNTKATLLVFELEAEDEAVEITDLPVQFYVTGATDVSDVIKTARLMNGSRTLKSKSIPATGTIAMINFNDIDLAIDADETVTLTVEVDFIDLDGDLDSGDTIIASTSATMSDWDVEDENGESVTNSGGELTGSATGETQTAYESGIIATFISAEEDRNNGELAGDPDAVTFTIKFKVQAVGDEDVYIDGDVVAGVPSPVAGTNGFVWATTTDSTTGTSTTAPTAIGTGILTADDGYDTGDGDVNNSGDKRFEIESGETRYFTFTVTIPAGGDNVAAGIRITGLDWDTTSQDNMANLYTFNLDRFQTDTVTGLVIR